MNKSYNWYRIAATIDEIEFGSNDLTVREVNGKKISLGRFQEQLFAFAYQCPHAAAVLADGYIDARGQVVCPMHGYKFNMSNGRNTSGEGYPLRHWPVELRPDGVYVGIDHTGTFHFLSGN